MDNDFDGFMQTLDNLNKKEEPLSDIDKQTDYASSFDIDIDELFSSQTSIELDSNCDKPKSEPKPPSLTENEMKITADSIKSFESNNTNTGEYALMHNQFMQSIQEIKDLKLSHDNSDINVNVSTPKISVDAALNRLLEEEGGPEQDDTVELSISDDNNDNESDSEIILHNIDDLESIASPVFSPKICTNTNDKIEKSNILSVSQIQSDSDSNAPEYDLESFGIKESESAKMNIKLRGSLPSNSSFEHKNEINMLSNVSSVTSSLQINKPTVSNTSTPNSKKSVLSNENKAGLAKLKQKIKSTKKNKVKNESIPQSPISKKNISTLIQTPRHSLKQSSLKNSRHSSKSSSKKCSPKAKINPLQLQNEMNILQTKLNNKDSTIQQLQDKIRQMETDFTQQKESIQQKANIEVKNAESKLFELECKLKKFQNDYKSIRDISNSDMHTIPIKEAQNYKKEIKSMDRIIESLNKENAKLLTQLKEQKNDLRQSQQLMYRENQKINSNLIDTQSQLTEMKHTKIEELQPFAFNQIQHLRTELSEIKKISQCRQMELGLEISKLKEQNRTLQFKLTGIDRDKFESETSILEQFKTEALKLQKKSSDQINELQRKLKWYIENQELIQNLNEQIKHKNSQLISLKNSQCSSPMNELNKNEMHKNSKKPNANEHRQIVALKKKVRDLEKVLASTHPDSIANLITIMNDCQREKSHSFGSENIIITQLTEQLDSKEDETLARLRGLRQQNDKVILQLKNKINNLQRSLKQSKRVGGFVKKPNARISELEKQICDLKEMYQRKIKTLRHSAQQRTKVQRQSGNSQELMGLKRDLECKLNEISSLNLSLKQKETMICNLEMIIDTERQNHNELKQQISLLQMQLQNGMKKHENIVSNNSETKVINNEIDSDCKTETDIIPETKVKNDMCEKEQIYIEKIKILESEIREYKRQCEILTEKIGLEKSKGEQSVKAVQNQLEWNKLETEKHKQLINKLEFELTHAKNTPSYVEYETLLLKLEKIEKRNNNREQELEQTYMKLLQTNDNIEEELNNKYEKIVGNKNQQIQSLQNELTTLMTAFDKIQTNV